MDLLTIIKKKTGTFSRVFLNQLSLLVLAIFNMLLSKSQQHQLVYSIKKDGKNIGFLNVKQIKAGNRIIYKMKSEISTRFIFSFTATGVEEAMYDKGILVYSLVYQKLNGNEKLNAQTMLKGKSYTITRNGTEKHVTDDTIRYNMVCLYNNEPTKNSRLFSDKHQKFLSIEKLGDHHYRINFPSGGSNEYFYTNGICTRIVVDHSFYKATIELKL